MRDVRAVTTYGVDATGLAQRAAELLPGPPPAHDCFGFLAWEELVLATARRLQPLLDDEALLSPPTSVPLRFTRCSGRLDAMSLLTLAVLLAHADDDACAGLLSAAVADAGDLAVSA